MPTSDFSTIPAVAYAVTCISPNRICDIGIGCGKYGLLFREALGLRHGPEWQGSLLRDDLVIDGVEPYSRYIGPIQRALYDNIVIGDIREMVETLGSYDLFTITAVQNNRGIVDRPALRG